MSLLLFSDIHLNTKPEDEYRWGLLPWINKQVNEYDTVICLGDITDAKDRHNAVLINRLVQQIIELSRESHIIFLKGNHDFIDPEMPFFGFCDHLKNVTFLTDPEDFSLGGGSVFLPTTNNPAEDWSNITFNPYKYIFCHQTFAGIKTDGGFPLPGIDPRIFGKTKAKVWSGDIHMPLIIPATEHSPEIEYVGAPYRTNYGDTYTPRVVLINNDGSVQNLHYPCPNKYLLEISGAGDLINSAKRPIDFSIVPGDWVKIRVKLRRADYPEWPKIKQEILEIIAFHKWNLHGQPELVALADDLPRLKSAVDIVHKTPESLVKAYAARENLDPDTEKFGISLLKRCAT